ncbi:unnamed protein product [Protopolystoma xenopodis]|uniref:Uncharacterized protein n=1 Tax=Protopolystoma xenopodis TaxID=117903 RepID=A0A448XEJ3_9PLAT|nr:unnamed protein product [Protopolystoma xenopodis]
MLLSPLHLLALPLPSAAYAFMSERSGKAALLLLIAAVTVASIVSESFGHVRRLSSICAVAQPLFPSPQAWSESRLRISTGMTIDAMSSVTLLCSPSSAYSLPPSVLPLSPLHPPTSVLMPTGQGTRQSHCSQSGQ